MENFHFYSPTYFSFGKKAEYGVGKLVKKFGGNKVLLHYGGSSAIKSGLIDIVKNALNQENISFIELGGVKPNPKSGLVYQGIELCKNNGIDFVLAVGGGSVIDSAKAIALGSLYNGDFWDFYCGKAQVENALPVGTVLTIAAAGSEGSPDSVITHENGNLKWATSGDALRPKFSILNPEYTCSLPDYQSACGIVDIFVHLTERYFTNTENVEITDRLLEGVLKTMISQGKLCLKNPKDYDIRANIMWAGMVAHNNVCGVGRVQDWASHGIEHELSALYDCAHGAGLAVIFPAWLNYVGKINSKKVVQFAKRVFDVSSGTDLEIVTTVVSLVKEFFSSIGMPINFEQLGAKKEDIPFMVSKLIDKNRARLGNYVRLDADAITEIFNMASK